MIGRIEKLDAAVMEKFTEASAYSRSDASRAIWYLLDALDKTYAEEIRGAQSMEELKFKLGASAQCRALMDMIEGRTEFGPPKV